MNPPQALRVGKAAPPRPRDRDFEPLALSMARRSKGLALIGFGGIARSLLNLHGLLAFIFEPWRHGPSRKKVLPIKTLGRCLTQTDDLND